MQTEINHLADKITNVSKFSIIPKAVYISLLDYPELIDLQYLIEARVKQKYSTQSS